MNRHLTAFTLVELLVVITIIVILAALLVPAMDKAVYAGDLAACSGKLKFMGSAVTMYASDNRRRYPSSPVEPAWEPFRLQTPKSSQSSQTVDRRPTLRGYMGINQTFLCPLVPVVNLEVERDTAFIWTAYNLWFGLKYATEPKGLSKVGDTLHWNGGEYKVLANDLDLYDTTYSGAHPPKDRTGFPHSLDDVPNDVQNVTLQNPGGTFVRTQWRFMGNRSPIDANAVFTDLSVQRYLDVHYLKDDRFARVPFRINGATGAITLGLPR